MILKNTEKNEFESMVFGRGSKKFEVRIDKDV